MSALISFLGGSAFRAIWGEIAAYFTAKQAHAYEVERMKLQGDLDAAQSDRQLAAIKQQAELGIKTIQVATDAEIEKTAANAWAEAVAAVGRSTGIKWLDAWNGAVRPLLATMAIAVVVGEVGKHGFVLTEWDQELVGGILGMYVADRALSKKGK